MKTSEEGRALIAHFESCKLKSYQDERGIWTVGYGHTGPEVGYGQMITRSRAEALLVQDLAEAEAAVNGAVKVPLLQHQFDALVSLTFNIGAGAFRSSTLLRVLNAGRYGEVDEQQARWIHAGGHVSAGLVKRRTAEIAMFAGQDWRAKLN